MNNPLALDSCISHGGIKQRVLGARLLLKIGDNGFAEQILADAIRGKNEDISTLAIMFCHELKLMSNPNIAKSLSERSSRKHKEEP
jgi:hypothetical protein